MTKINALRRLLLPCFAPSAAASAQAAGTVPKKRLSTSLRDDNNNNNNNNRNSNSSSTAAATTTNNNNKRRDHQEDRSSNQEYPPSSPSSDGSVRSTTHSHAPPRSSKSMVIGTIFGRRRGHVWFCVQHDRLTTRPSLLLELSMPVNVLVKEMRCGLVRVALECDRAELATCPLRSVPVWTMYCNGRKVGFAVRRKATGQTRLMLRTMQSITVGAGVIPAGMGSSEAADGAEVMYMRANYECVVGSCDSESFHLINPDQCPGQELSFFLLRTR